LEMDHHYVVGVNTELGPEEWKRDPATILPVRQFAVRKLPNPLDHTYTRR